MTNGYSFMKSNKNSHERFMHYSLMHSLKIHYSRNVFETSISRPVCFSLCSALLKSFFFCNPHTCMLHITLICVIHLYVCTGALPLYTAYFIVIHVIYRDVMSTSNFSCIKSMHSVYMHASIEQHLAYLSTSSTQTDNHSTRHTISNKLKENTQIKPIFA